MGLIVSWVDRKVTSRVQYRVGPPWYQNFVDVLKLMLYKETLIPKGVSSVFFLGMPVIAAAASTLISTLVLVINAAPAKGFIGDIIVVAYLLMIPPIALMLGGFSSKNTLASLGASREMKLMLAYELPFIISLLVPVIKSGYAIKLGSILMYQRDHGAIINSPSGILAFAVMLLCIHAKLGFVPFDIPEAETEIMAGPYIEYSGKALGIFKLGKSVLFFAAPLLLITLFFGGLGTDPAGFLKNALEYLLIVVIIVVIKNTNPRVRIDHAVRFFWGPVTAIAILSAALAYMGL